MSKPWIEKNQSGCIFLVVPIIPGTILISNGHGRILDMTRINFSENIFAIENNWQDVYKTITRPVFELLQSVEIVSDSGEGQTRIQLALMSQWDFVQASSVSYVKIPIAAFCEFVINELRKNPILYTEGGASWARHLPERWEKMIFSSKIVDDRSL
jgi:hypothetical protein